MRRLATLVLALAAISALPASADLRILIAKSECRLFFAADGELIKEYPCATGRGMCTPVRSWVLTNKRSNGGWTYQGGQWVYTGGAAIPMLGPLWMGLSNASGGATNYGIHGNRDASSIGHMASHGCIRMHNHHVDELYGMAEIGTKVRTANYVGDLKGEIASLVVFPVAYAARSQATGYDLFLTTSAGQGAKPLTRLPGDERTPRFSPDGAEIAFLHTQGRERAIGVLDPRQSTLREFRGLFPSACEGWTADGLVFTDATGVLRTLDPGTGKVALSPDFARPMVTPDRKGVLVPDPRGRARTVSAEAIRPKLPTAPEIESPSLSPDGRRLAFTALVGKQRDIFLCRSDGSLLRNLTESAGVDEVDPAWSPVPRQASASAAASVLPTRLSVRTDPPGLEISVRPPGSTRAYVKGKSPAVIAILEPTPAGGDYEVVVRDPESGATARETVWIAEGQERSVALELPTATDEATSETHLAPTPEPKPSGSSAPRRAVRDL